MKTLKPTKAICLAAALLLLLTATVLPNIAAGEAALKTEKITVTDVYGSDNDNLTISDGYDHGYVPNISAYQNTDGSYAVCVLQNDGTLKIAEISDSFTVKSEITVPSELDKYAAFTKGSNGTYYLLFGADRTEDEKSEVSLRLVNYSANGEKIRSLDLPANASGSLEGIAELFAGNHALAENGNYITGYVGREMFRSSVTGTVHQASYAFAIDLGTFTQVTVDHTLDTPYASHSFHQLIVRDGDDFIYVDRSDGEPKRSFHITKMSGGSSWTFKVMNDSFIFKGDYGYNDTYSQLGGLVKTSAGYLLVGSYQNSTSSLSQSSANIFTQLFDSDTLAAQNVKYLTSYSGTNTDGVTNPKTARLSDSKVAVAYMVSNHSAGTEKMRIAFVNAKGELISDQAVTSSAVLPRFGQIFYNSGTNSIEWFSISSRKLIVYSISLDGTEQSSTAATTTQPATQTTTDTATTVTTTQSATTTTAQATATTSAVETTTAQSTTQQPTQTGILQRIINFFMRIYNWIISLFS